MRKKITFLKSLLAILFLFGSMVVSAQVSEVWNKTATEFDWMGSYNARGIDYSPVTDHLYVAAGDWDAAGLAVKVLDPISGEVIKDLANNVTISDPGYGFHDVEVDDAGGIYAIMTTTNKWNPINIVYWENEDATPVVLFEMTGNDSDFGPGFSVKGDFKNGKSLIIFPLYQETNVGYIESENGVLGTYEVLALTGISAGKNVSIDALGTRIADGFWYDNSVTADASLINGSGNVYDALDNANFLSTGDQAGVKQFSTGGKDYLTVGSLGNIYLVDVTGVTDFSNVTLTDLVQDTIKGTDPQPEWSTPAGYGQEEAIKVFSSGGYQVFSLSAARYIKSLVTEEAPYTTDLLMTGYAMADSVAQVSYTYIDVNGDLEGTSLFSWSISDDDQGANKTEVGTDASYTVTYNDLDKYLSVSVLPVALTGTISAEANKVETSYALVTASASKPVASDLAIAGAPEVYGMLTSSYTFSDDDDDAEGESILKWWRADDATGTNAVEIAADTLMYKPLSADEDKFIIFSVVPVSVSPNLSEGDSVAIATAVVTFPAFLPVASNVAVSGIEEVSRMLTGSYDYSDLNEDLEGASVLTWYRADATDGTKTVVAVDTNMYTLDAADEGKYIFFGVKPVTVDDEAGVEALDTTGVIAPKPAESAPVASDVMVKGTPEVGAILSGTYAYFDYTDDLEGESIFKWYVADDAAGANPVVIEGASDQTLLIAEAQLGKFILFEVTPVAVSGGLLEGTPVSDTTLAATIGSTNEFGLERMWLGGNQSGALPYYLSTSLTERGIAVGKENIYIASRNGGTRAFMVDKEDGSYVGELSTTGIEGGTFAINDIEVSDDGQILAAPLVVGGTEFWIYKWDNELADPVKWLTVTLDEASRLGDKFTVTGDVSGNAIVMAAIASGNEIVRWVITEGVSAEPEIITLSGVTNTQLLASAVPFSPSADANILVSAKGFTPQIFSNTGDSIALIPHVDEYAISGHQATSPNIFNYKGRTMVAFYQALRKGDFGARVIVLDITSEPYQVVDSSEYVSNQDKWYGEVDITVDEDYYHAYILQPDLGFARYRGVLELPEFVEAQTTFEGDKLMATFNMALNDTTVAVDSVWTIMADDTKVAIDTIYSDGTTMTFEVATAITEAQVVTIAYDGLGQVVSFNGMPLGAFGPESVLNIVGADVPVATNVDFTGDVAVNAVLTGTYTFADPDGDLEGESTYQWYYATDVDGTDALKVIGGTSKEYTVEADMEDKFIAFEVTPVSATGGDDYKIGEAVMSVFKLITDVNETFAAQVTMYPNPANNVLNIDNCNDVTSINVLDYTGRVVMVIANNGDAKLSINISDLNSGVYLVQLNGVQGESTVKRIVKN